MPDLSSTGWTFTRLVPRKRLFADFEEFDPSSQVPGATKRFRAEKEGAEQEVKTIQQQPKPLPLKHPRALFLEDTVNLLPSSFAPTYCPESVKSSVTQWVESVSGSGPESYRERHCRSDTLLGHSNCDIIPRRFTKSASDMEYRRDSEGFALPPAPASAKSFLNNANLANYSLPLGYGPSALPSLSGNSSASARKNLVSSPFYRNHNLRQNNIFLRSFYEEFPPDIAELLDLVSKDCNSPHLPSDQIKHNTHLKRSEVLLEQLELGATEADVEEYFRTNVFPAPIPTEGLQRTVRNPMSRHAVPCSDSILRVSTPVPDVLYGYNRYEALPQQHASLSLFGDGSPANSQDLMFPFFVVEFKVDGPGGCGSMWTATNQCLGGSASCVNIAERLSRQCQNKKVRASDNAAFSIAMNGTEARLFITWKHDELKYYMRKVKSFLLQDPENYAQFLKYVLNIIDWGMGERLKGIQKSLDTFLEDQRKIASQQAKSCPPPPSDETLNSSRQKSKASLFHGPPGPNGQVNTGQVDGIGGLTGQYWQFDTTYNRYFHIDEYGAITWKEDGDESSSAQ